MADGTPPKAMRVSTPCCARDPASGLRDFEAVVALAERYGLRIEEDNAMPANNRLLVLRRSTAA